MVPDTDTLLRGIAAGDSRAKAALFERHRGRLRRMLLVRMDRRIRNRVDASDVVQETMLIADRKLSEYIKLRPLPFYPWLRQIAWEQLVACHRRHLYAARRSRRREQDVLPEIPTLKPVPERVPLAYRDTFQCIPRYSADLAWWLRDDIVRADANVQVLRYWGIPFTTSRNGRVLAAFTGDLTCHIRMAPDWQERAVFSGIGGHNAVFCLSPDGRTLAAASLHEPVQLWNTLTGRRLMSLDHHLLECTSLCFTADNLHLIAAGMDLHGKPALVIWDGADP